MFRPFAAPPDIPKSSARLQSPFFKRLAFLGLALGPHLCSQIESLGIGASRQHSESENKNSKPTEVACNCVRHVFLLHQMVRKCAKAFRREAERTESERKTLMKVIARTLGSVAVFAIVLWATVAVEAQDGKVQTTSCRKVVEGFYKWYIPETFRSHSSRYDLPLKSKVYRFDDGLVRLLRESEAYENRGGDIIDVDPFTGMNGDSEDYIVGNVRQKGDNCRADLYRVNSGKRDPDPSVTPALVRRNGAWVFFNFHYPGRGSVGEYDLRGEIRDQLQSAINRQK
jgi:hypothetical protein